MNNLPKTLRGGAELYAYSIEFPATHNPGEHALAFANVVEAARELVAVWKDRETMGKLTPVAQGLYDAVEALLELEAKP
jgi:hypothetical protein